LVVDGAASQPPNIQPQSPLLRFHPGVTIFPTEETETAAHSTMIEITMSETPHDPQDKRYWYDEGERFERTFVGDIAPRIGLDVTMNPAKVDEPWAHDIFVDGAKGDLKRQSTPFFTAGRMGMDPRFTVAFNVDDFQNYLFNHGDGFILLFWLDWSPIGQERFGVNVHGLHGVWQTTIAHISLLRDSGAPIHSYKGRSQEDERNNSTTSMLLDVRAFDLLYFNGYGLRLEPIGGHSV